ncbi:pseudouridylate synthase 4 [Multifurca ochricompacta]|uniref:tRNA pseudouridine(55) synthase n=1 Tax=Multifurca ochricompacta TaxID=376703 RepID=A0AAD4QNY7_9AGAM|nr:pseudouridylate synthase 4 [Multifurca ochricompacta]
MPKSMASLPLSGLFGVIKPSGPTSMHVVNQLKKLVSNSRLFVDEEKLEKMTGKKKTRRDNVKIGQGGTLDPLADGVLVVGVGKGTKKLNEFLDCAKEYRTTCLLGCETDTYDSEGSRVRTAPWRHVTREKVEDALMQFRGKIQQEPPIFSALKMDGLPLYDYARKGIPLPRPIEKRTVIIHSLELLDWKGSDHTYRWPEKAFSAEQKKALAQSLSSVNSTAPIADDDSDNAPDSEEAMPDEVPTAFVLQMRVSGGTYVRSIVHDLAHALNSAGHVVTLTRSRQKDYVLEPTEEGDRRCVPWEVFEAAMEDAGDKDTDGLTAWEREVLDKLVVVEGGASKS